MNNVLVALLLPAIAWAVPSFTLTIPAPSPISGRAYAFVSSQSCDNEPRFLVGDGQDTEQLFGVDVVDRGTANGAAVVAIGKGDLGYPIADIQDLSKMFANDTFCVQALFQPYDRFNRSDGHSLLLPRTVVNSYEGGALFSAPGTLFSKPQSVQFNAVQHIELAVDQIVPASAFPSVGPANDTKYIKHVKLRSNKLSSFWGRDVFLEATLLLPFEFDEHPDAKYPVFVYQGHFHADWATPVPFSENPPDPSLTGYEKVQAEYAYYLFKNWTSTSPSSPFYKNRGIILTLKHGKHK
jgi:hypothetical protein